MSTHPTAREKHLFAEDNRHEAALRARLADTLAHEHAIRTRARDKYASVSVQAPHEFHTMLVFERVSPRRVMDVPDLPGDESSDWEGAVA